MAKPRAEEDPTTARIQYRSRPSLSQRAPDQLPDDDENPMQVDSPSVIPITTLVATVLTTPRRDRPAPSTPKQIQGHGQGVNQHLGAVAKGMRRTRLRFPLRIVLCSWSIDSGMLGILE